MVNDFLARPFNPPKKEHTERSIRASRMTDEDRAICDKFIGELQADISENRIRKLWYCLVTIRNHSDRPFQEMEYDDLRTVINRMKSATNEDGKKRYSENTRRDTIATMKQFFRFLIKRRKSRVKTKELNDIRLPKDPGTSVKPHDLLTETDRDAMIKACQSPRDQAIISVMYEAGLRPVEIGRLRARDVIFTGSGMVLWVREKTTRQRKIPAPLSAGYMKTWFEVAPYPLVDDAIVFPGLHRKRREDGTLVYASITDDSLRAQLKIIADRAGVENYRHPYQFRHTAITNLINYGLPEKKVERISHGGPSQMLKRYYHVTDDEIEEDILAIHGMAKKSTPLKKPESLYCVACGTVNPSTMQFCGKCRRPLTEEAQKEARTLEEMADEFYLTMSPKERAAFEDRIAEKIAQKMASK